jgi:nitronate monooxygenase
MLSKTLLTRLFNIQYPIIQAPMSPLTTPELVANVSNAGGMGTIAAARMTGEQLKNEINQVRTLTDKPFGVNLFIPPPKSEILPEDIDAVRKQMKQLIIDRKLINCNIDLDSISVKPSKDLFPEQIEVILNEKIPALSFTFGYLTHDIVKKCKQLGIRLIGTATTAKEAVFLKEKGCDAVCLQGSEAGGHRGSFLTNDTETIEQSTIGLQSLLSQTTQFIDPNSYPLIAAGGIMDGYGLINAITSDASAVQMGTRFLTCHESAKLVPEAHRKLLLEAKDDINKLRPTVLTRAYTGKPARGIQTAITDHFCVSENKKKVILPWQIQSQLVLSVCKFAAETKQVDFMQLWAGQNYARCENQSAATIVNQIIEEAYDILKRRL